MAKIQIEITLEDGTKQVAKISGPPATAGLDSLTQFMATQVEVVDGVSAPKYADAADFFKRNVVSILKEIAPRFPSAQTKADVDEIEAKIAALQSKRDALFAAALAEE